MYQSKLQKGKEATSNGVKKIMFSMFALFALPVLVLAHPEDDRFQNATGWWGDMMGGYGNMMGMMGWGGMPGGAWGLFGFITYLVWLGISVLVLIWLYQKVFGKK